MFRKMGKRNADSFGIAALGVILAVISIAVVIGGGITVYKYKQYLRSIEYTGYTPPIRLPPEMKIATSSDHVDTSNWKNYRNEQYGFEVKYPPNWSITIGTFPTVSFTPRTDLNVFQNPRQIPLTQWVQQERTDLVSRMHSVTINGMIALRGKESGLVGYDAVYIGEGTFIIGILSQENSQDTAAFETMLSTFKFIK